MNTMSTREAAQERISLSSLPLHPRVESMNQTVLLNSQGVGFLVQGDYEQAIRSFSHALSSVTARIKNVPKYADPILSQCLPSSSFKVQTACPNIGVELRSSCVAYFERPFFIESYATEEKDLMTDELAAFFSSVCFYNMGLAMFALYKTDSLAMGRLIKAHDWFLRAFDLLAACKLEADDSKLILLLAICNNLAAIQGDLGDTNLLRYWGEKFQVILGFADARSHWSDANYHLFRLKQLLSAFAFSSAGAA